MEWVEISAKSIEEAKDRALDRLGVDERDAEFEVIEEPRTGIFGRTKGEARVRARVRPSAPRAKVERRDRRRDKPEKADKPAGRTAGGRTPKKDVTVDDVVTPREDHVEEAPARAERPAADRPRASRPRSDDSRPSDLEDLDLAQQTQVVADVVSGLIAALGIEAQVEQREVDEETAEVTVRGDQLGFLVGPRGRTLHALNEVTRSVVLRRGNTAPSSRVHVDVSGYRQRRREALATFTATTAELVRETGLPHALEPMGSADRKVIHDTVADLDGVTSLSEGEDHDRRVVIAPA